MTRKVPEVDRELEARVESLGFELVQAEWGGSSRRPVLRLRVDRPAGEDRSGITVDECARVSRGLEAWLDELEVMPERYVLEVSSPGVERPLVRPRDWVRFTGQEVRVKLKPSQQGGAVRLQGEVLGLEEDGDVGPRVALRLSDGGERWIPLEGISQAHLVYRWD